MRLFLTSTIIVTLVFAYESLKAQGAHRHGLKEPVNRTCPIDRKRANPEYTMYHENKLIAFCSRACRRKFKRNPKRVMQAVITTQQEMLLPVNEACPVDNKIAGTQSIVLFKGKNITFCSQECLQAFNDSTAKYVPNIKLTPNASLPINLVCPVMHGPVNPKTALWYKGNRIAFCCQGCIKPFKRDPGKYLSKK